VKDVLSVLRFAENPGDRVAGFRVLQLLPGIGPATADDLLERIAAEQEASLAIRQFGPPAACRDDWPAFVELLARLWSASSWPADLDCIRVWYEPHLERVHADAHARRADILQLEQIAAGFPTRERFLTELTLDPPNATSDQAGAPNLDEDYLILSTIHSAKGQEWKAVYVLNVVDGCIPSDMATGTTAEIDEERRLLYVAMTRAKDDLHLVTPQRFFTHQQRPRGDRHVYAARTRFIPETILDRFSAFTWPTSRPDDLHSPRGRHAVDLKARMRGRWS